MKLAKLKPKTVQYFIWTGQNQDEVKEFFGGHKGYSYSNTISDQRELYIDLIKPTKVLNKEVVWRDMDGSINIWSQDRFFHEYETI